MWSQYAVHYWVCEKFNTKGLVTCNSAKVIQFQSCNEYKVTVTVVSHVPGINMTVTIVLTVHMGFSHCTFLHATQCQLSWPKTTRLRIQTMLCYIQCCSLFIDTLWLKSKTINTLLLSLVSITLILINLRDTLYYNA